MDLLKILPHKYPLLLIDKVELVEPLKFCRVLKNLSYNEWFFNAHFPDNPIMPGSILLECFSQVALIPLLVGLEKSNSNKSYIPSLVAIDNVRFIKNINPGDILIIESNVVSNQMGFVISKVIGYIGDEIISSCKLTYKF